MKAKEIPIDPSLVAQHFAHQHGTLYRRRADGSFKVIKTLNGDRLIAMLDKRRVDGAALVWCLIYGNWPKYALAIIDGDPFNMDPRNIAPVFTTGLRYREMPRAGRFAHPLSPATFDTPDLCRANWNAMARERYNISLPQVLREEARERELREKAAEPSAILLDYERRKKLRLAALKANFQGREGKRAARPDRPETREDQAAYWHKGAWHVVPAPVHVSDDYRRRIDAYARGAVRSEYMPLHQETFYFDAKGEPVTPV